MQRRILRASARALATLTTVSALAGALARPLSAQATPRPWTLMVYGAADNNADGPILEFLDTIRAALDDDAGMELVLFIDRSEGYSRDQLSLGEDFTGGRAYHLRRDGATRLDVGAYFPDLPAGEEREVDSADPQNIGRFIEYCKAEFPAERYGLMIYSHANGITMCPDDQSGRSMGIAELADALGEESSVDFLALELCNMAGIEIAYEWRPGNGGFSADVLVAIPNAGVPLDWDRAFARIRTPGHETAASGTVFDPAELTALDFGKLIVEEGHLGRRAMFEAIQREDPAMAAAAIASRDERLKEAAGCYDLRAVADVKQKIDALAVALAEEGDRAAFEALRGPNDDLRITYYARREHFARRPYVDLYELLERTAFSSEVSERTRVAAEQALDAVDRFVVASFGVELGFEGYQPGRHGVFIVFPDGSTWGDFDWYTPLAAAEGGGPYGRWDFLADGATPGNGVVENWFELLDSWYDQPGDDPGDNTGDDGNGAGGLNRYAW